MIKMLIYISMMILLSFTVLAICSYPDIIECNTQQELDMITSEWLNNGCTNLQLALCTDHFQSVNDPTNCNTLRQNALTSIFSWVQNPTVSNKNIALQSIINWSGEC